MVIPDMLKNAPMFKRLDARIKVLVYSQIIRFQVKLCYGVTISNYLKNEDQIILFDKEVQIFNKEIQIFDKEGCKCVSLI